MECPGKNIFYSLIYYRTTGNFWTKDGRKRAGLWSGEVKDWIRPAVFKRVATGSSRKTWAEC